MIKIVALTMLFALLIVVLKDFNKEIAIVLTVASGLFLLKISAEYLSEIFSFINEIVQKTNIDKSLFKIIFKITAIGYLVEFGASTVEDIGLKSLSDKLIFIGKIIIFCTSIPIFYAVINFITELTL